MTNSDSIPTSSAVSLRMTLPSEPTDMSTIAWQIRLCRSTLGAVLDEIERGDLNAGALESIAGCALGVTAEIESLWEAVKKST